MMDDKKPKKGALLLLGDEEDDAPPSKPMGDEGEGDDRVEAARAVREAMRGDDDEAFADALEAFVHACR